MGQMALVCDSNKLGRDSDTIGGAANFLPTRIARKSSTPPAQNTSGPCYLNQLPRQALVGRKERKTAAVGEEPAAVWFALEV